jgi:hypothetical protein
MFNLHILYILHAWLIIKSKTHIITYSVIASLLFISISEFIVIGCVNLSGCSTMYILSCAVLTLGSQGSDPSEGTVVSEFLSVGIFICCQALQNGEIPGLH